MTWRRQSGLDPAIHLQIPTLQMFKGLRQVGRQRPVPFQCIPAKTPAWSRALDLLAPSLRRACPASELKSTASMHAEADSRFVWLHRMWSQRACALNRTQKLHWICQKIMQSIESKLPFPPPLPTGNWLSPTWWTVLESKLAVPAKPPAKTAWIVKLHDSLKCILQQAARCRILVAPLTF
jgi:hypothetical protein